MQSQTLNEFMKPKGKSEGFYGYLWTFQRRRGYLAEEQQEQINF